MKVIENIKHFYQQNANNSSFDISDEQFQICLARVIDAAKVFRGDERSVLYYIRERDKNPLTAILSEKEVDLAVLKIIYDDRYSFGHLYWFLVKTLRGKADIDYLIDPEAPFSDNLIIYAIRFDLEETIKEYDDNSLLEDRYYYALTRLHLSQSQVHIKHRIKTEYEAALLHLIEECRTKLRNVDFALYEAGAKKAAENLNKEFNHHLTRQKDTRIIKAPIQECDVPVKNVSNQGIELTRDYKHSDHNSAFAINYVENPEHRQKLLEYLHRHIDGKRRQNALIYIQAAISAGLLLKPSYPDLIAEFGKICSSSGYGDLVTESGEGLFIQKKETIKRLSKDMKDIFK